MASMVLRDSTLESITLDINNTKCKCTFIRGWILHLQLRIERATLVFFLYKCLWKNNSNVNSTNFTVFLEKIIKVLISQFWKRNPVGSFMNMVKNVLLLVAKFQNHVFVWSKYGANNIEGCLILFLFSFFTLFLIFSLWMIMTSATL
jgi:hypothetical protein